MKIYNTQAEIDADLIDGNLVVKDDIKITFEHCVVPGHINAWHIDAQNINALNIDARHINAWNIDYYATCIAYESFVCSSHKARRKNGFAKCLDGEIVIREKKCQK